VWLLGDERKVSDWFDYLDGCTTRCGCWEMRGKPLIGLLFRWLHHWVWLLGEEEKVSNWLII
jgi:hypothetical protein